jgi:hypothetical protein
MIGMKALWLFGTLGMALSAGACTIYFLIRGRWPYSVLLVLVAAGAVFGNPLVNMFVFSHQAERCREEMLATAKAENCVGRSTDWLRTRFGNPHQIVRDRQVEHWWYTPGPWYILMHEDSVGFQVEGGKITQAYMQIN